MTCCLPKTRFQLALAGAGLLMASALGPGQTGLLYVTDFEGFCVGPDQWVGEEQWVGNSVGVSAHGIDDDKAVGFAQTAFLGFSPPTSSLVTVARPLGLVPDSGTAAIEIDTVIGIEDSTNGHYDNFFLSFYNTAGEYLAALQFSNELGSAFGLWRDDGSTLHDTGFDFSHGQVFRYVLTIDLAANTWSGVVYLTPTQAAPLFTDQPFTSKTSSRDLGPVAYEWLLTSAVTNAEGEFTEHGNNWMLVADHYAWAIPEGTPEVETQPPGMTPEGQAVLGFSGEPGWTYHVEYADSLTNWKNNLPGSTFTVEGTTKQPLTFTDPTPQPPTSRFFRIQRTVTP